MLSKLNKLHKDNQNLIAHLKANIAEMEHYIDQVSADGYDVALVQYNQMRDCVSQYEQKAEYYTRFVRENLQAQDISDKYTSIEVDGVKQYVKKESAEELQSDFVLWLERTGRTSEQEEV